MNGKIKIVSRISYVTCCAMYWSFSCLPPSAVNVDFFHGCRLHRGTVIPVAQPEQTYYCPGSFFTLALATILIFLLQLSYSTMVKTVATRSVFITKNSPKYIIYNRRVYEAQQSSGQSWGWKHSTIGADSTGAAGKLPRYPLNNWGKSIILPRYYFVPICNQMLMLSIHNKLHNCIFASVDLMIVYRNALSTVPVSALLYWFTGFIGSLRSPWKSLNFGKKNSRPLKVLENRVGPWKSLKSPWIWMFHILKFLHIKILKKAFL